MTSNANIEDLFRLTKNTRFDTINHENQDIELNNNTLKISYS